MAFGGCAAAILCLAAASPAHANTWTGATSNDWFNAANWSGGVPITTTDGIVDTLTNAPTITSAGAVDRYTYVGLSNTATGSLTISSGGTLTSSNNSNIGHNAGSVGMATVTGVGSGWSCPNEFRIGNSGTGMLTVSDGATVTSTSASVISYNAGSIGAATVTGAGSSWSSGNNFHVGYSGTGTLTVSDGARVTSTGSSHIGLNAGSTGTATVTGAGSSWSSESEFRVGNSGMGTLTVSDGAAVSSMSAFYVGTYIGSSGALTVSSGASVTSTISSYIGNAAGSVGTATVTGAGSSWSSASEFRVGYLGAGTLNIADSGHVTSTASSYIGYLAGSVGTATVAGAGSSWSSDFNFYVGNSGTGTLNVENGGQVSSAGYLLIGTNTGSSGTLNISGAGRVTSTGISSIGNGAATVGTATVTGAGSTWASASEFRVGGLGTGTLTVSDAARVTSTGNSSIGNSAGSTGMATVTGAGSSWSSASGFYVGNSGTGTLTLSNSGTVSSTATLYIAANAGSTGKLIIGSASGVAASAAGSLSTPSVTFGSGTGSILFNHTNGCGSSGANCGGVVGADAAYTFASTITGNGTLTFAGGNTSLTASSTGFTGSTYIGGTATAGATLSLSGGADLSGATAYIGNLAGETGTANVSGSGTTWTQSGLFRVGNSGSGTLTISDAARVTSTGNSFIGYNVGSVGTVSVTGAGSSWSSAGELYVGRAGTGSLTVSNGAIVTSTSISHIGSTAGSTGTATVTGAGSTWASSSSLYVGTSGDGTLSVVDGGHVSSNDGTVGHALGATGTVIITGAGSQWIDAGALRVGASGTGALVVLNGGYIHNDGYGYLGQLTTGTGMALVSGENSLWSNASTLFVGATGNGTLSVTDAGRVLSASAYIAWKAGSSGTATVTGTDSTWTNSSTLTIGATGNGTLRIADSGVVSSTGVTIAQNAGSTGTLIIGSASGSTATTAGTLTTPTIAFGAGTGSILFNHTATNYVFASSITGDGAITALSGVTTLSGDLSAFTGTTTVSNAAQLLLSGDYGGDVDVTEGSSTTISSAMEGSLTLSGTSTAILASTATISGDVTIGSGSVFSDNGTVEGDVDVNDGGTLKGSGTIGGDATIASGATVAPGNSIGTLNVTGDVTFASGSLYEVEVNADGDSDSIIATGNATLNGGTVSLAPETGGIYGMGTTYTILTAASILGTGFDAITFNTSALFLDAGLSYDATNVYATLSRNATAFASAATTTNEASVAAALDSVTTSNAALNAVAGQPTLTGTQAAFRALTGELHAGIKGSLLEEGVRAQESGFRGADKGVWATAHGDWSERNGDNANTHAFTHKTKGITFGYDAPMQSTPDMRVGVAFSYGRSDYDLATDADNSANGNADHYKLAAYGSKTLGPVTLRTSGQYGLHRIKTDRTVAFTGYTSRERGDYHAQTLGGNGEAAYALAPTPDIKLEPFAGLSYGMVQLARFEETGSDAALSADSDLATQGSTLMGLRVAHQLHLSGSPFNGVGATDNPATTNAQAVCNDGLLTSGGIPCALIKAQLGWKHLIGAANPNGTYSFNGSQTFTTTAAAAPRNAFEMNLGFDLPLTNQAALNIAYIGSHAPEASANAIHGGVSWKW